MLISCPYKGCHTQFEFDPTKAEVGKYGRFATCPKCGKKLLVFRQAKMPEKPKVHMSKKQRLKMRNEMNKPMGGPRHEITQN